MQWADAGIEGLRTRTTTIIEFYICSVYTDASKLRENSSSNKDFEWSCIEILDVGQPFRSPARKPGAGNIFSSSKACDVYFVRHVSQQELGGLRSLQACNSQSRLSSTCGHSWRATNVQSFVSSDLCWPVPLPRSYIEMRCNS